ncbi:MAG: DNA cytosine methyltransferase [Acidipila sp.]|nr:DNA cytosine methyltransferase [Acidipila sp.]
MIPVIDLFAGPGGLGEGFTSLRCGQKKFFKIVLSIEKDKAARETLRLRSFFRQFQGGTPESYYQYLRGALSIEELYLRYPEEVARADEEAWLAELGKPERYPTTQIDERIEKALGGVEDWVLIGGPPCQAYSLVGRSRMAREPEKYARDHRHFLYQEYLRIIAKHRPPVFVMENVEGILSSKVEGSLIIDRILADLKRPCEMNGGSKSLGAEKSVTYKLYPFANYRASHSLFEDPYPDPSGYIIRAERHGIPQARHRLILLGVRSDLDVVPIVLSNSNKEVEMWKVIDSLPRLRSRLSRVDDSGVAWMNAVKQVTDPNILNGEGVDIDVWRAVQKTARELKDSIKTGAEFVPSTSVPKWQRSWFYDSKLGGACNHSSRAHIEADLWRYFFAACFAQLRGKSPLLTDFPSYLLPKHKNAKPSDEDDDVDFADRFRVQVKNRPSTTVTAHIAKDGHYFIHPDPLQCRSLTVREAARLQTFPDNYFFVGPRTEQYKQVGNAVPPLLARKLARVVYELLA